MSTQEFPVVVKAIITSNGKILVGKKEETEDHPISEKWHLLGGHLEKGEQVEEAIKREIEEETGLEVDIHQTVDVMTYAWDSGEKDSVQVLFHGESSSMNAEARDDLQEVKWVEPSKLPETVHEGEEDRLRNREEQAKFLAKLEKAPF